MTKTMSRRPLATTPVAAPPEEPHGPVMLPIATVRPSRVVTRLSALIVALALAAAVARRR